MTPDIGGYHKDQNKRKWPSGSVWESEGEFLYNLVTKEKPELVVEIGAFHGCSTTWIAAALRDNKKGKLISIDNSTFGVAWDMVPEWAFEYVECWDTDCFECEVPENIDILFEDGKHTVGFTERVLKRFPAKIVCAHDYLHPYVGQLVKMGFDKVVGKPDKVFIDGQSDCGIALKYVR